MALSWAPATPPCAIPAAAARDASGAVLLRGKVKLFGFQTLLIHRDWVKFLCQHRCSLWDLSCWEPGPPAQRITASWVQEVLSTDVYGRMAAGGMCGTSAWCHRHSLDAPSQQRDGGRLSPTGVATSPKEKRCCSICTCASLGARCWGHCWASTPWGSDGCAHWLPCLCTMSPGTGEHRGGHKAPVTSGHPWARHSLCSSSSGPLRVSSHDSTRALCDASRAWRCCWGLLPDPHPTAHSPLPTEPVPAATPCPHAALCFAPATKQLTCVDRSGVLGSVQLSQAARSSPVSRDLVAFCPDGIGLCLKDITQRLRSLAAAPW